MGNAHDGSDLIERDRRCLWHPYTQHALERDPLPVVRARGATLELADGREIVDAISSWWTCLHGHGHPRLVAALAAQAETLDHVLFAGATHEPAVALAEALIRAAPPGLARVFFSDDGSTAVEVALKIVRQSWVDAGEPQRTVFIALAGGYHGDTFGAMAVGDPHPFFRAFAPLFFQVERAPVETGAVDVALERLGERAAAVIVEPLVQGAGGMRMHGADFLRSVRAACDRSGVPLIADEVMTGFGRSGALFACNAAGIRPDLMCLAKGLTGGMLPLAATLATERLYETFLAHDRSRAFFHGHSFTANPIGCAVARASLSLCIEEDVPARLDAIGREIEAGLRERLGARVDELALRRTGGIVAFDLPDRSGRSGRTGRTGWLAGDPLALRARALAQGVLLRPLGNVIYAMPPACTSADQRTAIVAAMAGLAEAAESMGGAGVVVSAD